MHLRDILNKSIDIRDYRFRLDWLRLIRTKNIGARTFIELLNVFGDVQAALEHLPELARKGGNKEGIKLATVKEVELELERCRKFGAKVILACDDNYPPLLAQIIDFPPVITVKGNVDLLNKEKVAIVGARNASTNGCNFARNLANELGNQGYIITSGLAKGIDAAAHSGSLSHGTIAVIAGGIDNIYPKENSDLYNLMYEKGLVITEHAIGQSPIAKHFPQRNRIISGLSLGVVVVEAAKRSGTLITARFALEHGREVFAVPGFPGDPRCHGTNGLLKEGAILIESAQDVIEELNFKRKPEDYICAEKKQDFVEAPLTLPSEIELAKYRNIILSKLSFSPTKIDHIIRDLPDLPYKILTLLLLELELAGKIERTYGNYISLI